MNLRSKEYSPPPELSSFIETYWTGDFNLDRSPDFSQRVIPNGYIELIIHLSDYHCALSKYGDNFSSSPDYTLLGVYSKPYIVRFSEFVNVFGVRFFPDGVRNIFGVPPGEFSSTYEDGTQVIGRMLDEYCSRIREAGNASERIRIANNYFTKQLDANRKDYDITHLAMKVIREKRGLISFKELMQKVPISLRQLQREFKKQYGIRITDYIRLSRLNAINKYMLSGNYPLTTLAYDLDFADQSHFIREFKHYTGLSPKKFLKEKEEFIVRY